MDDEITTAQLAQLFSETAKTIADLGKRKIIERGNKRGTWRLFESVNGYISHLRAETHHYSLNLKSHQKIREASGRLRNLCASRRRKAKQFHCLHVNPKHLLGKECFSKKACDQSQCLEHKGKSEQFHQGGVAPPAALALILRHKNTEFLH